MVLWVTSGNTSNARLREIVAGVLPSAVKFIESGENLVEIGDAYSADPPTKPGT
jgi:predicted nuclease of predicted toxin-antitoxin system